MFSSMPHQTRKASQLRMTSQLRTVSESKPLSPTGTSTSGISCQGCSERLPVRLSQIGETSALWECSSFSSCSAQIPSVLITDCAPKVLARIRLADLHFDVTQLPAVPDVLHRLVKKLAELPVSSDILQHRKSTRVPQELEVAYSPADENYSPLGSAGRAIVHNISEHGIGFLSTTPVGSLKVAIELKKIGRRRLQVFGRVAGCREIGGQFYEIGVELELRLGC